VVFLERSPGTHVRTGISFASVILTNEDAVAVVPVFARVATPSAVNRMEIYLPVESQKLKGDSNTGYQKPEPRAPGSSVLGYCVLEALRASMDVIVDSNVLLSDIRMESIKFQNLFDYLRRTGSHFVIPRLVREEVLDKHSRLLTTHSKKVEQAIRELNRLAIGASSKIEFHPPSTISAKRSFRKKLTQPAPRIKTTIYSNVEQIDLNEVFLRGVRRQRPANEAGEELRDVIIWLIVLQYAKATGRQAAFISNDHGFWEGDSIHSHIQEDIATAKIDISLFRTIEDFVKSSAPSPTLLDATQVSSLLRFKPDIQAIREAAKAALRKRTQGTVVAFEVASFKFSNGVLYEVGKNSQYAELTYDLAARAHIQEIAFVSPQSTFGNIFAAPSFDPGVFSVPMSNKPSFFKGAGAPLVFDAFTPAPFIGRSLSETSPTTKAVVFHAAVSIFVRLAEGSPTEFEIDQVNILSLSATDSPPAGLRSIAWGMPPSNELKKMSEETDEGLSMFIPADSETLLPIFDLIPVEEAYSFEHQKFYEGHLWFDGETSYTKLKAALKSTFGQPSFENESLNISRWKFFGSGVEIHLHYQASHQKATLTYTNSEIK